jgi:hypothetical protein
MPLIGQSSKNAAMEAPDCGPELKTGSARWWHEIQSGPDRTLKTLGLYRDCPEPKAASQGISGGQFRQSRFKWVARVGGGCGFAMGIQSYFCCLTASRLPGNGIVERGSRSRCLHHAPAMKVLRIRKCLIVGTRSVRRASGLVQTGL